MIGLFSECTDVVAEQNEEAEYLTVRVDGILLDPDSNQPVALLTDDSGKSGMLIWIGAGEARALNSSMEHRTTPRPMTHDLLSDVMTELDGKLVQIRITDLKDNVYYALLDIETPSKTLEIDARPSDAMILALRSECPIKVKRTLFREKSYPLNRSVRDTYGMTVQELTDDLKQAFGYDGEGVLVANVAPGSPAEKNNIRRGDILIEGSEDAKGGKKLAFPNLSVLDEALKAFEGDFRLTVYRNNEQLVLPVRNPDRP